MREIKLRVWYPKEKDFYYTTIEQSFAILGKDAWVGPYKIQEYTGLKDKNGKEIYEGDILKVKGYDDWFDKEGFYYNRIVEHQISKSGESEISGFLFIPEDREVIGNIFENEELLEVCPKRKS
jgi:uncharacterized phage protein (TIGR01671 family)